MHKSSIALAFATVAFCGVLLSAEASERKKERQVEGIVAEGRRLMEEKRYDEALAQFETALKILPDGTGSLYNGGLAAYLGKHYMKAAQMWERLLQVDMNDWEGHAKLVQAYQALGDMGARDRHREILFQLRKKGVDVELSKLHEYRRDQFEVAGRSVLAFESFEMEGDSPVLYSFVVLKVGKAEEDYRISLGSYETTNKVAHELGEIGPADRLFHLDGYYPGGGHRTFGFLRNAPSYETVREQVLKIVTDEEKVAPGHTPGITTPPVGPKDYEPAQEDDGKPPQ